MQCRSYRRCTHFAHTKIHVKIGSHRVCWTNGTIYSSWMVKRIQCRTTQTHRARTFRYEIIFFLFLVILPPSCDDARCDFHFFRVCVCDKCFSCSRRKSSWVICIWWAPMNSPSNIFQLNWWTLICLNTFLADGYTRQIDRLRYRSNRKKYASKKKSK